MPSLFLFYPQYRAVADLNQDRKLDFEEFVIAQLLLRNRLQGNPIVQQLPAELRSLSQRLIQQKDRLLSPYYL